MLRHVIKWASIGLLLFVAEVQSNTQLETATKANAINVFLLREQIQVVSEMCEEPVSDPKDLLSESIRLIQQKTKIRIETFEEILGDETDQLDLLNAQLDEYDCLYRDNSVVIKALFDEFEIAVFKLDLAVELNQPIVSQKQWEDNQSELIERAINDYYDKSHVVAVGVMLKRESVPIEALEGSLYSTNKYWYRFDKGWKSSIPEYLAERTNYIINKDLENIPDEGYHLLFFVDKYNTIMEMVLLPNEDYVLERLNDPTWFYKFGVLMQ